VGPAVTSTEGQYWLPQHLPWSSSIQSSGFLEERDAGFCGTGTGGASKLSELEGSGRSSTEPASSRAWNLRFWVPGTSTPCRFLWNRYWRCQQAKRAGGARPAPQGGVGFGQSFIEPRISELEERAYAGCGLRVSVEQVLRGKAGAPQGGVGQSVH